MLLPFRPVSLSVIAEKLEFQDSKASQVRGTIFGIDSFQNLVTLQANDILKPNRTGKLWKFDQTQQRRKWHLFKWWGLASCFASLSSTSMDSFLECLNFSYETTYNTTDFNTSIVQKVSIVSPRYLGTTILLAIHWGYWYCYKPNENWKRKQI